jgi:hypothetical protein
MSIDPELVRKIQNPKNWPGYKPTIIAHDVGNTRDRSTAVVGGPSPFNPNIVGIEQFIELPQGLYGQRRAEALAEVDRQYGSRNLLVVDVSNDRSYAEIMFERFGRRIIGIQISRSGDGLEHEVWKMKNGCIPVYTIGRTQLFDNLHTALDGGRIRLADGDAARRAYQQLANLDVEIRETGRYYKCPPGEHDDLGVSCAMLLHIALHRHVAVWRQHFLEPRPVYKPPPAPGPQGWT